MEISLNHSLTVEKNVDLRTEEFRNELRKEVGYIETIFDILSFAFNVIFLLVLILPFIFVRNYFYLFFLILFIIGDKIY